MTGSTTASPAARLYFEDVFVGLVIPEMSVTPTVVQLFRFSAVTWNAHRIHYDREAARRDGHPDVLVQAHLHGGFLTQLVTRWSGPMGRLRAIAWKNRARAVPGDTLTCRGAVSCTQAETTGGVVALTLTETNQRGETCATGTAEVWLPRRDAPGEDSTLAGVEAGVP